jgi:tetrapyrrole methylase family protein/MazG family protein/ATP diphosphatase
MHARYMSFNGKRINMNHTQKLLEIMAKLRNPNGGCPWDLEQNFKTIVPYTIEEAYEVADAIEHNDMGALKEELGDLLLQVVFHAQMAAEGGLFTFEDVAQTIGEKMERRHPHVFGELDIKTAEAQTENWENIKAEERKKKIGDSVLADVPTALPALMRAEKLQKRAARVGFDWPTSEGVVEKILEELDESKEAIASGDKAKMQDEFGDLLFAVTNLARFHGIDPEEALRQTNAKFVKRFQFIEAALKTQNKKWEETNLDEMEALWQKAKTV